VARYPSFVPPLVLFRTRPSHAAKRPHAKNKAESPTVFDQPVSLPYQLAFARSGVSTSVRTSVPCPTLRHIDLDFLSGSPS
jgi:hypothetical protein